MESYTLLILGVVFFLTRPQISQQLPVSRGNPSQHHQRPNNNNLTYLVKCPEKTYSESYLGETARRIRSHKCYDIPYNLFTLEYR